MKGMKTGGRQKGTPNKSNAELKELARLWGPDAIQRLAELSGLVTGKDGKPRGVASTDQAQVAALRELLDRGYGKPAQPIANDDDNPFRLLMESLDGRTRGVPSMYEKEEVKRPTSH